MKTSSRFGVGMASLSLSLVPSAISGCRALCLQFASDGCCAQAGDPCVEDHDCRAGNVCRQDGICVGELCDASSSNGDESAPELPDPATGYCVRLGGVPRMDEDVAGQVGMCVLPDGNERDQWELYCGDCFDGSACGLAN